MHVQRLDLSQPLADRQLIETQLLEELRRAEAAFKEAGPSQRETAEEEFRAALRRFSELVLDRRVPPGLSVRP